MKNVKRYDLTNEYADNDVSEMCIGYKNVCYEKAKMVIVQVVIRGTNGTLREWTSNFDIGDTNTKSKFADWEVENNHKGIDVAPYLEPAKWAIVSSYLGGIEHSHYPESYYVLASNIKYAK